MILRPELAAIVEALLEGVPDGGVIELDALGEAVGARAISQTEIDAMIAAIEARGRTLRAAEGERGEAILGKVLEVARLLRLELGRAPRADEIVGRSGLSRAEVDHALALARVIQR